jgi:hypothetical protein
MFERRRAYRVMETHRSPHQDGAAPLGLGSGCEQHAQYLEDFGAAVRDLLELHEQQWLAIIDGDDDSCRFDVLIHMANERKQAAKYAYLHHVETHGCSDFNAFKRPRARGYHG